MAKKITISVSDALHEKIEKWRKSFNLSKMFQDALSEAIQKKEDFQKRLKKELDIESIIERLKSEKADSEEKFFEKGKHDGLKWSRSAHYDDLQHVIRLNPYENPAQTGLLKDYFTEKIENDGLMKCVDGNFNKFAESYIAGWKQGVIEFWEEIEDKLAG